MKSILIAGLVEKECDYKLQKICNEVHTVNDWFNFYGWDKLNVTHSWRTHPNVDYMGLDGRCWNDGWKDMYNDYFITMISKEHVNGLHMQERVFVPEYIKPYMFNSSLCYIMHYALMNRFDRVYLTGIKMQADVKEYFQQLPILIMWIDLLRDHGVDVRWRQEAKMRKMLGLMFMEDIAKLMMRKTYYGC